MIPGKDLQTITRMGRIIKATSDMIEQTTTPLSTHWRKKHTADSLLVLFELLELDIPTHESKEKSDIRNAQLKILEAAHILLDLLNIDH